MPVTYEPIATTTLSTAGTITFSSIPSTYTDLRVVLVGTSGTNGDNARLILNSDTNTNYSYTNVYYNRGVGSSSVGATSQSSASLNASNANLSDTVPCLFTIDLLSYANTSVNKTFLVTGNMDLGASGGSVCYTVGLWRNTSAITTINLTNGAASYKIGTTATLYGIKAA